MNLRFLLLLLLTSVTGHAQDIPASSKRVATTFEVKKELATLLGSVPVDCPPSIITATEWDELHLDMFLDHVDNTQTGCGPWALRKLTRPTIDLVTIEQMQQALTLLEEDKQLYLDLKRGVDRIAQHEQVLIDYYNPSCPLHTAAQKLYYDFFFKEQLNNSRRALDGALAIDVGRSALACGGNLVLNSLLELGPRYLFNSGSNKSMSSRSFISMVLQRYNPGQYLLKDADMLQACKYNKGEAQSTVWTQGSLGDSYATTVMQMQQRCTQWSNNASYCASHLSALLLSSLLFFKALGHDLLALDSMQKSYYKLVDIWTTKKELRAAVGELVVLFQDIKSISEQVKVHKQLASLTVGKQLEQFETTCSTKLQEFLAYVHSVDPLTLSYGQMLLMHKKMQEIKDELVPLLQVVGFVDALLSIVDLIKEYEKNKLPICFVEFVDHPSASVRADNFWLPLLHTSPVPNSTSLGYGGPNKLVLTGPNGGGKSTVMKSICYLVLLGQSWGIAPASQVTMTLFDGLKTSFYPQEDISNQLSTFMAEKRRMELIQRAIDAVPPDAKLLIALDEPYRGTIEAESAKRVFAFGTGLKNKSNVGLLLATHLEQPTYLAQHSSAFVNYQLEHQQDRSGQFKRTFKLLPGPAVWWFKDAQKRAAFIDSL